MLNVNKKDERWNIDTRVNNILNQLDTSGDKALSREEFIQGIKNDDTLRKLLLEHELDE